MRLRFQGDAILPDYGRRLAQLSDRAGREAMARAINRATEQVRTRVIREIARQGSIRQAVVRKAINFRRANRGNLEASLTAKGWPLPLREFRARQFSWGVRARVWGETKRFPGTFIRAGSWRGDKDVAGGHVFQRQSTASHPIKKQYGASIPTEMVRGESREAFERLAPSALRRRLEHEIDRLLSP